MNMLTSENPNKTGKFEVGVSFRTQKLKNGVPLINSIEERLRVCFTNRAQTEAILVNNRPLYVKTKRFSFSL